MARVRVSEKTCGPRTGNNGGKGSGNAPECGKQHSQWDVAERPEEEDGNAPMPMYCIGWRSKYLAVT